MLTLSKISAPGWDKEFEDELDLFEELWDWVCQGCLEDFKRKENRLPASYDELLSTACGCEFMVEDHDE